MVLIGIYLFLFIIILFLLFRPQLEQEILDDHHRARMSGHTFATLPCGVTHYEWGGPEDGPKVALVHGFSSPMFIWDHNFHALADAGFRVLRYDLLGRGLSDRPHVPYDADLFVRQLHQLLASQGVNEAIDLVGLSMGGGIVMHFTDRYPERVRKVALFAPVGFNTLPFMSRLMHVPGLGEWLMRSAGDRTLLRGALSQLGDDPAAVNRFREEYLRQLHYKGCKRALLSTLRHGPMAHLEDLYHRVGQHPREGMLFWGAKDEVVPYPLHHPLLQAVPWLQFHPIQDGLHTANYQRAAEVNPPLINFLR
jgi:pimeloyl-ACP methyl ester carboxylesterase